MVSANLTTNLAAASIKKGSHAPAAATAAVITITAIAEKRILINGIQGSYSNTPTGGRLTITMGGSTVFDADVTAAGLFAINPVIPSERNEEVIITLASGGGSVSGKINAQWLQYAE